MRSLLAALFLTLAAPVVAQPLDASALRSPILTVDSERLYAGSLFGQSVAEEFQRQSEALAAENRLLEAELDAAEAELTAKRSSMSVADFRAAAEGFDARVQEIRSAQDQKQYELQRILSQGREMFLEQIAEDMAQLMREAGAAVILDRRSVFLGIGLVDITETAILKINETYRQDHAAAPSAP